MNRASWGVGIRTGVVIACGLAVALGFASCCLSVPSLCVPPTPHSLSGTAISASTVRLEWSHGESNVGNDSAGWWYEVERREVGQDRYGLLSETEEQATSYLDATCAASTTYQYRVRAVNSWGRSRPIVAEVSVPAEVPDPPTATVSIVRPAADSVFYEDSTITFEAVSSLVTSAVAGSPAEQDFDWYREEDYLGSGRVLALNAAQEVGIGQWTIRVELSIDGEAVAEDSVQMEILPTGSPDDPPSVVIVRPLADSTFSRNAIITLEAEATDDVDEFGDLSIDWYRGSTSEHWLGSGSIIAVNAGRDLGLGRWLIRVVVTDTSGGTADESVPIEIVQTGTGIEIEF